METILTVKEVAAQLKFSEATIRKYVLKKSIPYYKVGGSVRFMQTEIDEWLLARIQKHTQDTTGQLTDIETVEIEDDV